MTDVKCLICAREADVYSEAFCYIRLDNEVQCVCNCCAGRVIEKVYQRTPKVVSDEILTLVATTEPDTDKEDGFCGGGNVQ